MNKTGRNEPCPCGSGKKYKKCCLPKEQQRKVDRRPRDETDDFFEDLPADPAQFNDELNGLEDEDEVEEAGAHFEPQIDDEPFLSNTIADELPKISEGDRAVVDTWWTAYRGMKGPDEIIQHLSGFFQAHPGLVSNLELHHEVLFELGAQLVKAGRASDYIDLLLRVRRDFPMAYLKSYSYFDLDIIRYKIASRTSEGIKGYLNWFEEYPDSDADNFFSLIDFLMATGCDEPLAALVEATYYPICRSENVFGGTDILEPLFLSYCAPYLNRGWTRANLEALSEQLQEIRIPLNSWLYRPAYLDSLFKEILGELDTAFFSTYHNTRNINEFYRTATYNFMGWLHEDREFSWMKSQFYRRQVNRYLTNVIPDGKRPKQAFVFSRNLLENTIARDSRKIFSLDATRALGSLNAIYWFADYLLQHQVVSQQEGADVQTWCEEIWRIVIPQFLESEIEAPAFDIFPQ